MQFTFYSCRIEYELDWSNHHVIMLQTWENITQCSVATNMGRKAKISKGRAVIQPQSLPSAIFPEHWMILFHVCNTIAWLVKFISVKKNDNLYHQLLDQTGIKVTNHSSVPCRNCRSWPTNYFDQYTIHSKHM